MKKIALLFLILNIVFLGINIATLHNLNKIKFIKEPPEKRWIKSNEWNHPFTLCLHDDGKVEIEGDTVAAVKYLMEELYKAHQQLSEKDKPVEILY